MGKFKTWAFFHRFWPFSGKCGLLCQMGPKRRPRPQLRTLMQALLLLFCLFCPLSLMGGLYLFLLPFLSLSTLTVKLVRRKKIIYFPLTNFLLHPCIFPFLKDSPLLAHCLISFNLMTMSILLDDLNQFHTNTSLQVGCFCLLFWRWCSPNTRLNTEPYKGRCPPQRDSYVSYLLSWTTYRRVHHHWISFCSITCFIVRSRISQ